MDSKIHSLYMIGLTLHVPTIKIKIMHRHSNIIKSISK